MAPFRLGLAAAFLTLAVDQASKLGLYLGTDLVVSQPWAVAPFTDFVVVWNRGVSYGMFQQEGDLGRWLLVGLSIAAALALGAWMHRAGSRLLAVSLGMIVGGAIGNAIDRAVFGAVFDFVHLHAGDWSWYVFNIADAAIVAGVVGLVVDSLMPERKTDRKPGGGHDWPGASNPRP